MSTEPGKPGLEPNTTDSKSLPTRFDPNLDDSKTNVDAKTPQQEVMGSLDLVGKMIGFNSFPATLNMGATNKLRISLKNMAIYLTGNQALILAALNQKENLR